MNIELIFIIIILYWIYEIIFNNKFEYNKIFEKTYNENIFKNYYIKSIFTKTELDFYKKLKNHLKNSDLEIFSKIRLADFIWINNNLNFSKKQWLLNKINKKHIDFIITDYNWKIKYLIELDDKYHNFKKSKENDNFKNELFNEMWIKLIRFYAWYNYNFNIIQ